MNKMFIIIGLFDWTAAFILGNGISTWLMEVDLLCGTLMLSYLIIRNSEEQS